MKTILCLVLVLTGCQADREAPKATPAPTTAPGATTAPAGSTAPAADAARYAQDIARLCDVVKLAGADQVPAGERQLPIANWLAANLETPESRQFLVRIQPLVGDAKADALEAEAKQVGLPGCALAAEWRTPTP